MNRATVVTLGILFLTTVALAAPPAIPPSVPVVVSAASMQAGNQLNVWGDSFSLSEDSTSQIANSWPYQFQLISGLQFINANLGNNPQNAFGGIGGQTSVQIGERQGGIAFTVTFSGNVLNTGANSVTAVNGSGPTNSTGPISSPSQNSTTVMSGTVCTQHGVLTRTASGGPPSVSETYSFTPDSSLSSFPCSAASLFTPDNVALASQPAIIEAGRNDFLVSSGAQVEASIASMVALYAAAGNIKYLVLSIPNGEGEGTGTDNYTAITTINAYLASTYGSHYLDWRSYMVSQANAANPVDVLDQANDIPPYSLRAQDANSTLASAITTAGQTSFNTTVAVTPNTILKIGSEYIYVLTTSGTTVSSSTRGYAGTTAATYTNGTAFTGTDFLHWSGATPAFATAGYTLVAKYIAANDNIILPPATFVASPFGTQQTLQKPPTVKSPVFVCPCSFVNTGVGGNITFYGSTGGPPVFLFKNQGNNGSAQFGFSADGNNINFLGNALEWNSSDFATKGPFVLSGTGLGTSPTITGNGSVAGSIVVGSSPSSSTFTLTYSTVAVAHGYSCSIADETNNASIIIGQTAHSTTSATFQSYSRTTGLAAAMTAADALVYACGAF